MRVNAVIVAAGEGRRMGQGNSKALLPLAGKPLILHTLYNFKASKKVGKIVLVVPASQKEDFKSILSSNAEAITIPWVLVDGGETRQDSVGNGLRCLDSDCEVVVIHDGARPFVSADLIDRCAEAAFREGAAIVAIPAKDTVKIVSPEGLVRNTPSRDEVWQAQTPQAFKTEVIRGAYGRARLDGVIATDDSTLVERLGKPVRILEGEPTNLKMTFPEDLLMAEALLREGKVPH